MYRRIFMSSLFILSILILSNLNILQNLVISAQTMDIIWIQRNNYSSFDDKPYATCLIGDYIYVVGYDKSMFNAMFRIEKRNKFDGSLVKVWTYNPSTALDDLLLDCVVVEEKLYVVGTKSMFTTNSGFELGKLVVAVLDRDLNLLKIVEGPDYTYGSSITSDGKYIYVGGIQRVGAYSKWYIEKRDLDLNLIVSKTYGFKYDDVSDQLYSLRYNPVTGTIWAVGSGDAWWNVVILDTNLDMVKQAQVTLGGSATSITFDEAGYAYVAGVGVTSDKNVVGIVKYDPNGDTLYSVYGYYGSKIAYVNGDIYLIYANPSRHIVYVFNKFLKQQKTLFLNNNTGCSSADSMGKISSDGTAIYFATTVCRSVSPFIEDTEWVIYAFTPLTKAYFYTITTTITSSRLLTTTVTNLLTITSIQRTTTTVYLPTTSLLTTTDTSTLYIEKILTVLSTITLSTTATFTTTIITPTTYTFFNPTTSTIIYSLEPKTYTIYTTYILKDKDIVTITTTVTTIIRETDIRNRTITITSTGSDVDSSMVYTAIALGFFLGVIVLFILREERR